MQVTEYISLDELKVPNYYKMPKEEKIQECMRYLKTYGKLDRDIVVDKNGYIIDGYVAFVVLKNMNVSHHLVVCDEEYSLNASYRGKNTTYVFGHHIGKTKEYCWRIYRGTQNKDNLEIGKHAVVVTAQGVKSIVITRIDDLNSPPVDCKIKKVIKCLNY